MDILIWVLGGLMALVAFFAIIKLFTIASTLVEIRDEIRSFKSQAPDVARAEEEQTTSVIAGSGAPSKFGAAMRKLGGAAQ